MDKNVVFFYFAQTLIAYLCFLRTCFGTYSHILEVTAGPERRKDRKSNRQMAFETFVFQDLLKKKVCNPFF